MFNLKSFICFYLVHRTYCDWGSEWVSPISNQFYEADRKENIGVYPKLFNNSLKTITKNFEGIEETWVANKEDAFRTNDDNISINKLKFKLETTLRNAILLSEALKLQIIEINSQETILKESIANGRKQINFDLYHKINRWGLTIVTISTIGQTPRTYMIREGDWKLCNGIIQIPTVNQQTNFFNELATPRCIGQEVATKREPCAYNSVIKYEVVPTSRRFEYSEDDYLCLKVTFNNTLEQYMSVTQQTLNYTCTNGIMRSLRENIQECGIRVLSDYTFYPYRSFLSSLMPVEYCTQRDGSCKLMVAWHVSNTTIENFEFLENDENFKNFFIKPELVGERQSFLNTVKK